MIREPASLASSTEPMTVTVIGPAFRSTNLAALLHRGGCWPFVGTIRNHQHLDHHPAIMPRVRHLLPWIRCAHGCVIQRLDSTVTPVSVTISTRSMSSIFEGVAPVSSA